MADNTTLSKGTADGDTIRDKDRTGVKTPIVALDLNPAGAETLMAGSMPVTVADGADATLGAKADAAVTNPAVAASAIALLKGLLSTLEGTLAVSAAALPLPAGASTAADQATANTSLASIDGKTPALGQALAAGSVPVVLTAAQLSTLTPLSSVGITGSVAVTGTFWQATQPVSAASLPLPTGAATSANQTTANTSLASIDSKTPSLGQALAAGSVPVVLTAAQLTTLTPLSSVGITGTVACTQSGTWNVGTVTTLTSITNTVTVTDVPATSGGWSSARIKAASGTNATNVKASAGQVGGWYFWNDSAAKRYIHFYDSASAPTAGAGTPKFTVGLPAGGGANVEFGKGVPFTNGIGYTITTGISDTDTGSCTADDVHGVLLYK